MGHDRAAAQTGFCCWSNGFASKKFGLYFKRKQDKQSLKLCRCSNKDVIWWCESFPLLSAAWTDLSTFDTFITASYLALIFFLQTPAAEKDKAQAGPSKSPSLPEIKNKLSTAAKEVRLSSLFLQITALNWMSDTRLSWWLNGLFYQGKPLPKTEQKFENFVRSSFKITDKKVSPNHWPCGPVALVDCRWLLRALVFPAFSGAQHKQL